MSGARNERKSGFTLVEVMIAIGIMTVGSLGILSMHHAVTQANKEAREMNAAIAITERWVERVERDSLSWTAQGLNTSELNSTAYLKELATTTDTTDWFRPMPPDTYTTESYGFDFFNTDTRAANDIKYCVNLRMAWLRQGSSARVDVRTFWYREGHTIGSPTHPDWVAASDFRSAACDAATADGWNLGVAPNVNVIFASTVVTWMRRDPP